MADWENKDKPKALEFLEVAFNKANKKGAKAITSTEDGDYNVKMEIRMDSIDFGNAAAGAVSTALNPFSSGKDGGCILDGKIVVKDKDGNNLAILPFTKLRGLNHWSEATRYHMALFELMNKLGGIIKAEKKKSKKK